MVESRVITAVSLLAMTALESVASLVTGLSLSEFPLMIWDIISSRPNPRAMRESTFSRLPLSQL